MRSLLVLVAACSLPPRPETPVVVPLAAPACEAAPVAVRTVHVDPTTLAAAIADAQPGDRIELAAGVYPDALDLARDGTADAPIVITGAGTIRGTWTVHDRGFIQIRGLTFDSPDAQAWILTDGDVHDLSLIGNAFDSHAANRDDGAFVGVGLTGSRITVCGNAWGSWLGDELSADRISGLLIENNDWSQASAQHALVAIVGHRVVIRGNAFRNPWQRVLHITDRSDDDRTDDVVVEHNSFIDSDWITGAPNPSNEEQFMGGNEVVRFLGARGIFRDNLLVGNHEGDNWDCHGILNFQTFISSAGIDTRRFAQFRVYNNTFDHNETSSIIFYVGEPGLDLADNKFENNVITGAAKYAVTLCDHGVPLETYRFAGNVIPGAMIHLDPDATHGETISTVEAETPVFTANVGEVPAYVDASFGASVAADFTSYGVTRLADAFAAYRLARASAGAGTALAPATIAVASTGTTITVDDALWFSDGMGMTTGDRIRIGTTEATVISRDVSANTLMLDSAVAVVAGEPVVLIDATADPGIW